MGSVEIVLMNGPREGDNRTVAVGDDGVPPAEIRVVDAAVRGRDQIEPSWVYVYRRDGLHSGVWWYVFDRRRFSTP